jgi:hypothetical protein
MNGEGVPVNVQDTTDGGQTVLDPLAVRNAMMRPCTC